MAPITAADPTTVSAVAPTSTTPAASTSTFTNPLDTGYVGPNVPIWVGYIIAFVVLAAIVVLCYYMRREARVYEKKNSIKEWKEKTKLKLASDSDSESSSSEASTPPAYSVQMGISPADAIAPPPAAHLNGPADTGSASSLPRSEHVLGRLTRANTVKNQRRAVQVFAKPPPPTAEVEADAYGGSEAVDLPPILRLAGARW